MYTPVSEGSGGNVGKLYIIIVQILYGFAKAVGHGFGAVGVYDEDF